MACSAHRLLGISPRTVRVHGARQALPGMMGLLEEGQQVMEEEEKKEDAAADLALIGPLTQFRRPGISRSSLRQKAIVVLLEKADQLLNQVAPSLMPVAKMPAAVEQATIDGAE